MTRKIVTDDDGTGIWVAWFAGEEDLGRHGYGSTEAEAIQDLKDMYGEDDGDE